MAALSNMTKWARRAWALLTDVAHLIAVPVVALEVWLLIDVRPASVVPIIIDGSHGIEVAIGFLLPFYMQ